VIGINNVLYICIDKEMKKKGYTRRNESHTKHTISHIYMYDVKQGDIKLSWRKTKIFLYIIIVIQNRTKQNVQMTKCDLPPLPNKKKRVHGCRVPRLDLFEVRSRSAV